MTDAQIARLFAEEQRLERALAVVRARIAAARAPYAERNHLLMYPSIDAMRKAVVS
jgi:hypothetical protein